MTYRISVLQASIGVIWLLNVAAMTVWAQENGKLADRPVAPVHVERLLEEARKAQADPVKKAYAGWLDYLATQIAEKPDQTDGVVSTLTEWLERIETDPQALAKLRGCHEWAYLSKVDGTGQPFQLSIPDDYDPQQSWPLLIFLHGRGGTHHASQYVPDTHLLVCPLGRSRAGRYTALSEVDVLEVMAYVRRQWNVDPDRIHIKGGSMGGGGTFNMATRHPDLFASAQPLCGYYAGGAIENALNLPLYALHSRDDFVVPIVLSRMPTRRLAEIGSRVVLDEADGFGHKISSNKPAVQRALRWAFRHTRQQTPPHVHLIATDELARRAYWTEIVEWGPAGRPAVIDARLDNANVLYLTLDNVAAAKLDLAGSPVDRQDEMMGGGNAPHGRHGKSIRPTNLGRRTDRTTTSGRPAARRETRQPRWLLSRVAGTEGPGHQPPTPVPRGRDAQTSQRIRPTDSLESVECTIDRSARERGAGPILADPGARAKSVTRVPCQGRTESGSDLSGAVLPQTSEMIYGIVP